MRTRMGKVVRGVHTLPVPEAVAEDPLGIATATHRVGEPMTVTVYPRIAFLRSCVLHPELGLRQDWAGAKACRRPAPPSSGASGPTSPASRSATSTGRARPRPAMLMLREMEEPAGADITLLLDGSADQVVGNPPADQLRTGGAGRGQHRRLRAAGGTGRHPHLPRDPPPPGPADAGRRGTAHPAGDAGRDPARTPPLRLPWCCAVCSPSATSRSAPSRLTLVGMTLDAQMARALVSLREDGVQPQLRLRPGPFVRRGRRATAVPAAPRSGRA